MHGVQIASMVRNSDTPKYITNECVILYITITRYQNNSINTNVFLFGLIIYKGTLVVHTMISKSCNKARWYKVTTQLYYILYTALLKHLKNEAIPDSKPREFNLSMDNANNPN